MNPDYRRHDGLQMFLILLITATVVFGLIFHFSSTPAHHVIPKTAPAVVIYEICQVTPTPQGTAPVKAYATCVNDVTQAWHDERNWK